MPAIIVLGAVAAADRPVAPGVKAPFAVNRLDGGRGWDGMRVLSSCEDEADDSFAESG